MIDPKIIEEIKMRNPIEDVMQGYTNLKRAGSNMLCLCPFHSEKTPSCTVFLADQSFYCFGCGVGGDVISFIRRAENLEYVEAIKFLAKRVGITIPEDNSFGGARSNRDRFYKMNLEAARFFRNCLFDEKLGAAGREYLRKRQMSDATVKHFGIGFAPDDFSLLTPHLLNLGYTKEEIKDGFLGGVSQKSGRLFDYFRNRVIFPIFDTSRNIIGFGGRTVVPGGEPKYLNTSDTPVFKKRKNLYALNYAKNHCAEQMILCEGYMDVIALHAAGFENAVATLGTAITPEQGRLMARYTKKVIISYDSDSAGINATNKALKIFSDIGLEATVMHVVDAKDPDEFIKKFGPDAFSKLLGNSKSKFRFSLDSIMGKYDLKSPDDTVKCLREICGMLASVYSQTEREIYIREISEELKVSPESIKNDTEKIIRRRQKEAEEERARGLYRDISGISDRVNPDFAKNTAAANTEEHILSLILLYPEHRSAVLNPELISEGDFLTDFDRRVFKAVISLEEQSAYSESALGEVFNVDELSRIQKIKLLRIDFHNNGANVLKELCVRLKEEKRKDVQDVGDMSPEELADFIKSLNKR